MSTTLPDIEQIVREVLKRIESQAAGPAAAPPDGTAQPAPAKPPPRLGRGELELTGRVISLSQVEGQLAAVRHVTIGSGAVVTPSARDYLKAHRVQLNVRPRASTPTAGADLYLATFATPFELRPLCSEMDRRGITCRVATGGTLPVILQQWAPGLTDGAAAVVITGEPDVVLCAANRRPGFRAFAANQPARMSRARTAIGGNLLVVDPAGCSDDNLRDMVCTMARHASEVPLPWRDLL